MAKSLEEIRAYYKQSQEKKSNTSGSGIGFYPHYKMSFGKRAVIRFLPDANEDNPYGFFVKKLQHFLDVDGEQKIVPCLEMYEKGSCPICAKSREYYAKAKSLEEEGASKQDIVHWKALGKKFYRSLSHIYQVLVVKDGIDIEGWEKVTGKQKLIELTYQIIKAMEKQVFGNPEEEEDKELIELGMSTPLLEHEPYSYENGTDFFIFKDKAPDGKKANYTGSTFAKNERPLTEEELAEINLIDLNTVLPKSPNIEEVKALLSRALGEDLWKEDNADTSISNINVDSDDSETDVDVDELLNRFGE